MAIWGLSVLSGILLGISTLLVYWEQKASGSLVFVGSMGIFFLRIGWKILVVT